MDNPTPLALFFAFGANLVQVYFFVTDACVSGTQFPK